MVAVAHRSKGDMTGASALDRGAHREARSDLTHRIAGIDHKRGAVVAGQRRPPARVNASAVSFAT